MVFLWHEVTRPKKYRERSEISGDEPGHATSFRPGPPSMSAHKPEPQNPVKPSHVRNTKLLGLHIQYDYAKRKIDANSCSEKVGECPVNLVCTVYFNHLASWPSAHLPQPYSEPRRLSSNSRPYPPSTMHIHRPFQFRTQAGQSGRELHTKQYQRI